MRSSDLRKKTTILLLIVVILISFATISIDANRVFSPNKISLKHRLRIHYLKTRLGELLKHDIISINSTISAVLYLFLKSARQHINFLQIVENHPIGSKKIPETGKIPNFMGSYEPLEVGNYVKKKLSKNKNPAEI